jgi:hypothetical protein
LAAGRRLPAFVAVGRRLAAAADGRADIFDAADDLAEVDFADFAVVRPWLLRRRLPVAAAAAFDLPLADDPLVLDALAVDRLADRLAADPLGRLPLPLFLEVEREALRLVRLGMTAPCPCDKNPATSC